MQTAVTRAKQSSKQTTPMYTNVHNNNEAIRSESERKAMAKQNKTIISYENPAPYLIHTRHKLNTEIGNDFFVPFFQGDTICFCVYWKKKVSVLQCISIHLAIVRYKIDVTRESRTHSFSPSPARLISVHFCRLPKMK